MNLWQQWQQWTDDHQGLVVVGLIPGEGCYDLRYGEVFRLFLGTHHTLGAARRATTDELTDIQVAMDGGWLQIEARPPHGITGSPTAAQACITVQVLYVATGIAGAARVA